MSATVIYKRAIDGPGRYMVDGLPVSFGYQPGIGFVVWFIPKRTPEDVQVVMTGEPFPLSGMPRVHEIRTAQTPDGSFVLHALWRTP